MPFTHTTESNKLLTNTLKPVISFSTSDQDINSFDANISSFSKSDRKAPSLFRRTIPLQDKKARMAGQRADLGQKIGKRSRNASKQHLGLQWSSYRNKALDCDRRRENRFIGGSIGCSIAPMWASSMKSLSRYCKVLYSLSLPDLLLSKMFARVSSAMWLICSAMCHSQDFTGVWSPMGARTDATERKVRFQMRNFGTGGGTAGRSRLFGSLAS